MDINGGDKNRVFLHDLIKITEGTVSEGTIFMHISFVTNVQSLSFQIMTSMNTVYINTMMGKRIFNVICVVTAMLQPFP
jgi:hypothetical protein